MPLSFHQQTVTRVRAGLTPDRYGDSVRDWANATLADLPGCRVLPDTNDTAPSNVVDRDRVIDRWLLFAPPDTDLVASDRVRLDDGDYEVDGDVMHWPSPTGRIAHLEVRLMRVKG